MPIDDIYTEVLTQHSTDKRNKHELAGANVIKKGDNPSCGDEIQLELIEKDGLIVDAAFTGAGCAVSQASTSIMTDLIRGKSVAEAKRLANLFIDMIKGHQLSEAESDSLEDAVALQGVSKMPARVKCAVLAWHTLINALDEKDQK